jgi:hypothetical protein
MTRVAMVACHKRGRWRNSSGTATHDYKLQATASSADRLVAKRWSSRSCPGGLGDGWGDHDSAHHKGAAWPMTACGVSALYGQLEGGGEAEGHRDLAGRCAVVWSRGGKPNVGDDLTRGPTR